MTFTFVHCTPPPPPHIYFYIPPPTFYPPQTPFFFLQKLLTSLWSVLTGYITVNPSVPPRWTVEPTDKQFAQGSDAKVDCKADGFPKPQISWKKAAGICIYILVKESKAKNRWICQIGINKWGIRYKKINFIKHWEI